VSERAFEHGPGTPGYATIPCVCSGLVFPMDTERAESPAEVELMQGLRRNRTAPPPLPSPSHLTSETSC